MLFLYKMRDVIVSACNGLIGVLESLKAALVPKKSRVSWTLCPKCDALDDQSAQLMDVALANPSIHNIAVSGAYGSGKSTFLQSYFLKHKFIRRHVLWVSLLDFLETDGRPNESQGDETRRDIERRIIQQILCSADGRDLPYSRLERTITRPWIDEIGCLLLIVDWILAVILWQFFIRTPELLFGMGTDEWKLLVAGLTGVAGILLIYLTVAKCFRFAYRRLVSASVKVGPGEVNFAVSSTSAFAENLNEIVYFFRCTRFHTVVFEDIDRLDDTKIFTGLRDLNGILNNTAGLRKNVRFIYAVRDDLFEDGIQRTKFFDFIVPVLSYASSFNARDILARQLCEGFKVATLPRAFIKAIGDLANFVPDMRTLNNICNEFFYYRDTLNAKIHEQQKLFGLVVAKNLMPGEFSRIRRREGVFSKLLMIKTALQDEDASHFEVLLAKANHKLKELQAKDPRFVTSLPPLSPKQMHDLREEEKHVKVEIQDTARLISKIRATQLITYIHRGRITRENIAALFDKAQGFAQQRYADLLYKLLDTGYLLEDFESLISREQKGYLDSKDKEFERDVILYREIQNWNRPVVSPQDVVDDLDARYFAHPQVLNVELLEYLLKNDKMYRDKLRLLVGQLKEMGINGFRFINAFLKVKTTRAIRNKLFLMVSREWGTYTEDLISASTKIDINCQLGAYIHMANYDRMETDVLSPSVWSYLDKLKNVTVLLNGDDGDVRWFSAAIEHFGFTMKGCNEAELRKKGLWAAVENARRPKRKW